MCTLYILQSVNVYLSFPLALPFSPAGLAVGLIIILIIIVVVIILAVVLYFRYRRYYCMQCILFLYSMTYWFAVEGCTIHVYIQSIYYTVSSINKHAIIIMCLPLILCVSLYRSKTFVPATTNTQGFTLESKATGKHTEAVEPTSFSTMFTNNTALEQHSKYMDYFIDWWFICCVAGTHEPVPVPEFAEHVRNLHANDDYLFTEEYAVSAWTILGYKLDSFIYSQSVEPTHGPTSEATRRPANISKNRYANITACMFQCSL